MPSPSVPRSLFALHANPLPLPHSSTCHVGWLRDRVSIGHITYDRSISLRSGPPAFVIKAALPFLIFFFLSLRSLSRSSSAFFLWMYSINTLLSLIVRITLDLHVEFVVHVVINLSASLYFRNMQPSQHSLILLSSCVLLRKDKERRTFAKMFGQTTRKGYYSTLKCFLLNIFSRTQISEITS